MSARRERRRERRAPTFMRAGDRTDGGPAGSAVLVGAGFGMQRGASLFAASPAFFLQRSALRGGCELWQSAPMSPSSSRTADRFPPQVKYILGNEACERFSLYGMRAILVTYMTGVLHLSDSEAEWVHHLFVASVYFMPLVGGWLADRYFGRYAVILWMSLGYVAGHACIAFFEGEAGLYAGLALIAMGSGAIKPNVSTFVGDQFGPGRESLMEKAYFAFYWAINIGSINGQFFIPKIRTWYGWQIAFAVPGVAMALSLVIFLVGKRHYIRPPPSGPQPESFGKVFFHGLARVGARRPGKGLLDGARDKFSPPAIAAAEAVLGIIAVFFPCIAFWMCFDQYSSSWVLQAQKMDLDLFGVPIEAEQFGTLDALLILVMVPAAAAAFGALEKRGRGISRLARMTGGMFITVLSFASAALVQHALDAGVHVNIVWQSWQYFFLAAGETLVSVTALEFAYSQAPKSMKSTIMSVWFLTFSIGNLFTGLIAKANPFQGAAFFWFFSGITLVAAVLFAMIAKRYRSPIHAEGELPPNAAPAA
ncbi:MAG TPA: MFS transporter [Polyangiaceae bacterium]|nr:MFS transporter [Polyangiaceae bacterium]